jgi:hypothetical protein
MLLHSTLDRLRSSPSHRRRRSFHGRQSKRSAGHAPAVELLENRSLPSVAPLPIPGGVGPFLPGEPFQHINLPGPADAPPPIGNDPSTITDFNGFVGVAHFEGTGTDNSGTTLLWDADLRFMTGVFQGVDGNIHHGTFVEV